MLRARLSKEEARQIGLPESEGKIVTYVLCDTSNTVARHVYLDGVRIAGFLTITEQLIVETE